MKRRIPHGPLPGRGGLPAGPRIEATVLRAPAPNRPVQDPHVVAARERLGRVLCDKWRLDELLGVGGVAAVYGATHRNGRRVAIKLMHAEVALDATTRDRFLREGYLANQVQHPGVVSVLDDDVTEDGAPLLVMELLDGESIQARWERKGRVLQPGEVLSIVDQALDVLAAAHARGVVHRDVKPANLFLTRTGVVKLLDFGLARGQAQSPVITMANASALGTPAFLPPEQALGRSERVDGRTDLWAVGATMLTLLSGRHVHQAQTLNELLLAAMTRAAPRSAEVVPGLPRDVGAIIDRALSFEQKDRFPTARAMQHAVREAYQCWSSMSERTLPRSDARSSRSDAEPEQETAPLDSALGIVRIALAVLIGITWGTQMARGNVHGAASAGARARVSAVASALHEARAAAPSAEASASDDLPPRLLPSSSTAIVPEEPTVPAVP